MTKQRVPETDQGIQGEITVAQYDLMQRSFREKGWIETQSIIDNGSDRGHALEIGHGPGYLGLEWLKKTKDTHLTGLDISPDMQKLAQKNAKDYGFTERTHYQLGNINQLPFEENTFDAVFTNGSLHEWSAPLEAFNEIWRVLKPGGKFFISDLRRDMKWIIMAFLWISVRPTAMRHGLLTSIHAAYTPVELANLISKTDLKDGKIELNGIGIEVTGTK